MQAIDLDALERRSDAEEALRRGGARTRRCAASCSRTSAATATSWAWQPNLEVLGRDLDELAGWPEEALAGAPPYDGPMLWIGGAELAATSRDEYVAAMDRWFPRNRRVTIKGAGHWVHSEQPEVFIEVLRRFLAQ